MTTEEKRRDVKVGTIREAFHMFSSYVRPIHLTSVSDGRWIIAKLEVRDLGIITDRNLSI